MTGRQLLSVQVRQILDVYPDNDNYGIERMRMALEQQGIRVSRATVYRVMNEMDLIHNRRRPHGITHATTEVQEKESKRQS